MFATFIILSLVLFFLTISFITHFIKRHRSIKRTVALPCSVKIHNLMVVLEPSGFTYDPKEERTIAHFDTVTDHELLPLSNTLIHQNRIMFCIEKHHWWLTGFLVGKYAKPKDLIMEACITFPNHEMLNAYVKALLEIGFPLHNVSISYFSVRIYFEQPVSPISFYQRIRNQIVCTYNRVNTALFRFFTRPFVCTLDRLTYLLGYSPLLFRILTKRSNRRRR